MPGFGLAHKPSRSKMRSVSADSVTTTTPTSHSQRSTQMHHQQPPISPAPMPIETSSHNGSSSGSGFKMFNWKRKGSGSSASSTETAGTGSRPYYPAEPPRPILKTAVSDQGSSNRGIRFAASAGGVWDQPAPASSVGPLASAPNIAVRGDANGVGGGGQPLFHRPTHSQGQGQGHGQRQGPPPQLQIQIHQANLERQSQELESMGMTSPARSVSRTKSTSPRRSSRPASPSTTSFGQRIRTESAPITMNSCSPTPQRAQNQPLPRLESRHSPIPSVMCTPPAFCPSHVTTPPVAYCSSMQSRAPPPPSPYRPTTTQDRSWSSTTRALPEQLPMTREMAPRPPRHSSLFTNSISTPRSSRPGSRPTSGASISALAGVDVPMLNIIPATPQELNDEFSAGASAGPNRRRVPEELGEAVQIHRMTELSLAETESDTEGEREEISTEALIPKSDSTPAIRVELDFSPFSPTIDLALDDYITNSNFPTRHTESEPAQAQAVATTERDPAQAQSSPPASMDMESYPSLPSLSSQTSITSGTSLRSSSSMSSVMTFPDVEEALGSMLASLSDGQISFPFDADMITSSVKSQQDQAQDEGRDELPSNPGLGLGLDFPQPSFITAPLSPRKSKPKPKPTRINTALAQSVDLKAFDPTPGSAPPVINHRVAFYGTARAHPRSPSSGVFTRSLTDISAHCDQPDSADAVTITTSHSVPDNQLEVQVDEEAEATTPTLRSKGPNNGTGIPASQSSSSALSSTSRDSVLSTTTIGSQTTVGYRDSISGHSESSDEDLHTASIINLTPVARSFAGGRDNGDMESEMGLGDEMRDEEVMVDDVGLAL